MATGHDTTFEQEQEHLSEVYATLEAMRDELTHEIEVTHKEAALDLKEMSEEIRPDFIGADEAMETLAAIETLNSVIDAYNQRHDFSVERLTRVLLLLQQPYFAKVTLKMRPNRPPRDVYIGAAGITDEHTNPLIVDWRSPVAETYYNQEMGMTSYDVDGRTRTVELLLRRQFDIARNTLKMYFDTNVAIEDSLLLGALKRHHSEKLQNITATIQREQNTIVRHEDVPALLVNGIAGSGKTSVMLQRIAYLLYRQRKTLRADQLYLFTPNSVFASYIDTVLPSMGEANPQTFTWKSFLAELGLSERGSGAESDPQKLCLLEEGLASLEFEAEDLTGISFEGTQLVTPAQTRRISDKFLKFPVGPRRSTLIKEALHETIDRKIGRLAREEAWQEQLLSLDIEEQLERFDRSLSPETDAEVEACTKEYLEQIFSCAHKLVEQAVWLRIDRIGMRILGTDSINAAEWLYLKMLITGEGAQDARYVMIDEVQDYSVTQLTVLARYFSRAHFLMLGDERQAIREGTASFAQIRELFAATHGEVVSCDLLTSYRSSPEITALFAQLVDAEGEGASLSSVRRPGQEPQLAAYGETEAYLEALRSAISEAAGQEGLTAVIAVERSRVQWLSRQLGDAIKTLRHGESLPVSGVVLIDLALAKGLEFDQVIIPDAQAEVYPETTLASRRLYTAISRAMHRVSILSQGPMTALLAGHMRS